MPEDDCFKVKHHPHMESAATTYGSVKPTLPWKSTTNFHVEQPLKLNLIYVIMALIVRPTLVLGGWHL